MQKIKKTYPALEEQLNIYTHGLGLLLSLPAGILLFRKAAGMQDTSALIASGIFASSLFLLYLASTLYHSATIASKRKKLNVFDHSAIYVLIAGTYTPVAVISLHNAWGWAVLIIIWSMAFAGILLKLFFTGRFKLASTLAYVVMGWTIVIALKPMLSAMTHHGLLLLAAGGFAYTLGALMYQLKKIPYNHAVFHVFVLIGSFCHFLMVYNEILQ